MNTSKKRNNFVNNQDLLTAMIEYKKAYEIAKKKKERAPIPEYIGKCFLIMSQKMSNHRWFMNYTQHWKEEMIGDAVENCCMYLYNFDPEKSPNPFAYFTQVIYYAFRRRLDKERKQQYIKLKTTENFFIQNDLTSEHEIENALYENNYDSIKAFEDALVKKKKKVKPQGIEKFI